jgi:Domain of unknown function (DUF4956)
MVSPMRCGNRGAGRFRLVLVVLLLALAAPPSGAAQASANERVPAASAALDSLLDTAVSQGASGTDLPHKQRKVTQAIGELEPIVVWQWGPVLATALAMAGAIVLTFPVAMAYMWTKPAHDYDPGVMHSSLILAPTIAGLLIVIQGSLAMAFSLAGVATAVRFRNSLKDTNDAVYVFVAVAIGLAAGVQALDIALAISLIFSATVLLLSRSPFREEGTAMPGGSREVAIRAGDPGEARPAIESVLQRETRRWRLERSDKDATGAVRLLYAVRCRKRMPYAQLLAELRAASGTRFTVETGR